MAVTIQKSGVKNQNDNSKRKAFNLCYVVLRLAGARNDEKWVGEGPVAGKPGNYKNLGARNKK